LSVIEDVRAERFYGTHISLKLKSAITDFAAVAPDDGIFVSLRQAQGVKL